MGMLCRLVQLPHAAPNSTTRCSRAPHRIARPLFSFFGGFCLLGVLGTCRHVQTPGQDAKVPRMHKPVAVPMPVDTWCLEACIKGVSHHLGHTLQPELMLSTARTT